MKNSSNHLGELFAAACAAHWWLNVVAGFRAIDDIAGRPADQLFAVLASQLGEQNASVGRDAAALDPILNRLVRDAHLPRHIGNGVELGDGSLECRVLLAILAQAWLVPQETFQLPQGFPVEKMAP